MKKSEADKKTTKQLLRYVVTNLIKQEKQCIKDNGCAYGDGQGNHCGVGWILDETNEELMNFRGSAKTLVERKNFKGKLPKTLTKDTLIWRYVQSIHDATSAKNEVLASARDLYPEAFKSPLWTKYAERG